MNDIKPVNVKVSKENTPIAKKSNFDEHAYFLAMIKQAEAEKKLDKEKEVSKEKKETSFNGYINKVESLSKPSKPNFSKEYIKHAYGK